MNAAQSVNVNANPEAIRFRERPQMKNHAALVLIGAFALTSILICPIAKGQKDAFPEDEEIKLVMTQIERALVGYRAAVDLQGKLMKAEAGVEDDRKIIEGLTALSKAIGEHPQKFNGQAGYEVVLLLDDVSRNAALCTSEALKRSIGATVAHDSDEAESYLLLSQNCTAISESFYTVSENASALYRRYVKGEVALAEDAFNTAVKCNEALTKAKSSLK